MQTIEELHPISTTIYFLAVMGIVMFCTNPIMIACAWAGAVLYFLARNGRGHAKLHISFAVLFAVLALVNPMVSHNGVTVLFVMNDNPVTLEAFLYGVNNSCSVLAEVFFYDYDKRENSLCVRDNFTKNCTGALYGSAVCSAFTKSGEKSQ